jgi:SAM-dependent methyltransferase
MDSLALARHGAIVTGVDFSNPAISKAQSLSTELSLKAEFVCCDVYSVADVIPKAFDIVFTSYGTVGWLPDLEKWAAVISNKLLPGGEFVMVDFHPVLWMFDNEFNELQYSYFNLEPIIENSDSSYATNDAHSGESQGSIGWNHSLADILGSLRKEGLIIDVFKEYDYSPYPCFKHLTNENGKYRIQHLNGKLPMLYAIRALKP